MPNTERLFVMSMFYFLIVSIMGITPQLQISLLYHLVLCLMIVVVMWFVMLLRI